MYLNFFCGMSSSVLFAAFYSAAVEENMVLLLYIYTYVTKVLGRSP